MASQLTNPRDEGGTILKLRVSNGDANKKARLRGLQSGESFQ
jgi:hypothetical protein